MNISSVFIHRPVTTTLLTLAIALTGLISYFLLPVSPLPQVDFPTISVQASLPGASPEIMSTSVATPLERHLGEIADVAEMTSSSSVGSTRITLQFGLDRNIDGAARDVQAAINAARADLPTGLRSNPTYRKVNPADAPIMILALNSNTLTQGQIYDSAATVLQQSLSQVEGIGQVNVGGSSLPAVRVDINPDALFKYGISLEDVRAALAAANAHRPKGFIESGDQHFQIYTNDQARHAEDYQSLVVAYHQGAAVRLSDVANVTESVEDIHNQGLANGKPSVLVILFRQPGANIIDTINKVKSLLPKLQSSIPRSIDISVVMDRSTTIHASLVEVEHTLFISIILVILVVFIFLHNARASLIPSVAVPVSLIGTLAIMYLLNFSLDNLSLMALTIATGFVVDDAIVVMENITRYLEAGLKTKEAALQGAREVSFTVFSISVSLVSVFIPLLLMGGIVGRLLREFALTLSIAILVSLIISLTTTPMMCSNILKYDSGKKLPKLFQISENAFNRMLQFYRKSLAWSLGYSWLILGILIVTIGLNIYLFVSIPKGFFPQQDTGRLMGGVQADQSISFQSMRQKVRQFSEIIQRDPAVESVASFTGGGQTNSANIFVSLKDLSQRDLTADQVIAGLRRQLGQIPGASLFLQSVQDIRIGGRQANAQYQYTLQSENLNDLRNWTPRLVEELRHNPTLTDVNTDQQEKGLELDIDVDRSTASRFGITFNQINNALYDSFGQRQVSTIYNPLNQYHVVMELSPEYWETPESLNKVYVNASGNTTAASVSPNIRSNLSLTNAATTNGLNLNPSSGQSRGSANSAINTLSKTMVPLAAFSHYRIGTTPLSVNHQGHFAASTISFNLVPGKSLSDASDVINRTMARLGVPSTIHGSFQGTAQAFQESLANEPVLILAALLAVYIVLGILYESYIHPITILSTLPSAGVGAVLALMVFHSEFNIMALIGVILLIGIVKKNAIMMIDFALDAERNQKLSSRDAIYQACLLRFRPIMMTTMAALFGAIPLAFGTGYGSELRRPLGISIIGGLIFSQILTLYTTPIIYLYLARLRLWGRRKWQKTKNQETIEGVS